MGLRLYKPLIRRAVRLRRDGAPPKLLTDMWDRASDSGRRLGLRRLSGLPERGTAMVPGLFDK